MAWEIQYANGPDTPDSPARDWGILDAADGTPPHCNWDGSSPGTNGSPGALVGQKGETGASGGPAPIAEDVYVTVAQITGDLTFLRSGGRGGNGGKGGNGSPGQHGGNGKPGCASGVFSQPATVGGAGGNGGDAGNGGDGGTGAPGGTVYVLYKSWPGGPNLNDADPGGEGFVLGRGGLAGPVGDPGVPGPGGIGGDGIPANPGGSGRVTGPPNDPTAPKPGKPGNRGSYGGELEAIQEP
jgi:hypothetical protein